MAADRPSPKRRGGSMREDSPAPLPSREGTSPRPAARRPRSSRDRPPTPRRSPIPAAPPPRSARVLPLPRRAHAGARTSPAPIGRTWCGPLPGEAARAARRDAGADPRTARTRGPHRERPNGRPPLPARSRSLSSGVPAMLLRVDPDRSTGSRPASGSSHPFPRTGSAPPPAGASPRSPSTSRRRAGWRARPRASTTRAVCAPQAARADRVPSPFARGSP